MVEHLHVRTARKWGEEAGRNAASWFWDDGRSNATAEDYQRWLDKYDDGDPAVTDQMPFGPLSGEYADSMTPTGLLAELGIRITANALEANEDVIAAYEEGFYEASQDAIVAEARMRAGYETTLDDARNEVTA